MMGKRQQRDAKLFYTNINLDERVPANHPLRTIASAIDFSFIRDRVAKYYGPNGHESIDPTVTLKLMFLSFYENVRSERELARQLPMRLDWLWFCELDLDDPTPDHSVLSKARRLWGVQTFQDVFHVVLQQCAEAGLIDGETVYADSTVLKADASVDSRVPRRLWNQLEAATHGNGLDASSVCDDEPNNDDDDQSHHSPPRTPPPPEDTQAETLPAAPRGRFNTHMVSRTDPDAATTSRRGHSVTLGYRDHTLVDGRVGLVLSTIATAADYDDGALLIPLLERYEQVFDQSPKRVVGDSQYGTKRNLAALQTRQVQPYLKRRPGRTTRRDWLEHLPDECAPALAQHLMKRRLHTAEGRFAEAHERYGHRRCRWRRRWRVQIQCYLVAMVQNVTKLARHGRRLGKQPAAAAAIGAIQRCDHAAQRLFGIACRHRLKRANQYIQSITSNQKRKAPPVASHTT